MLRKQPTLLIPLACIILSALLAAGNLPAHAAIAEWHVSTSPVADVPTEGVFPTIQAAINAASEGDTVSVHPGTYAEVVNFNGKNITVQSLQGFEQTIISGKSVTDPYGKGLVIFENGEDERATLSGFTIRDSLTHGIACHTSGPTLAYLKITGNTADEGAGMLCGDKAHPILMNSVISDNSTSGRGGGAYCKAGSSLLLKNVEIAHNSAFNGGAIGCDASEVSLMNVTLSDNSATFGPGIFTINASFLTLTNTILWNSGIFAGAYAEKKSTFIISHSDIQGGQGGILNSESALIQWSDGNINVDPLFANPENRDYRLSNLSPCIEAGTPAGAPDTDIQGIPRPSPGSTRPDMGAYENLIQDIHVDAAFTGEETGAPDGPYKTITEAIQKATPSSTIHVAEGTYTETLTLENMDGIKMKGGWKSGFRERYHPLDPTVTVIMTHGNPIGVRLNGTSHTLMEGFTIMGDGVGLSLENSSDLDIRSNIVRMDCASGSVGIRCEGSSGHILQNRIHMVSLNPVNVSAHAMTLKSLSGELFLKNNILCLQGNNLKGIQEADASATPASLLHNEFYRVENAICYLDANGRGYVRECRDLNNGTLSDIPEQGGNFCNLLPLQSPCEDPPCPDVTLPTPEDTDGDGMPDNFEIHHFGEISPTGAGDADGDGLTNLEEYESLTNPASWDTDGDAMADAWEILNEMRPLTDDAGADPDNDGYTNLQEHEGDTDPNDPAGYPFVRDDFVTTEENTAVTIPALENDDGDDLFITSLTQPANKGTVQEASGKLVYTPAANFWGRDVFTYTLRNGSGHTGAAEVTVHVRPVPDEERALSFDGSNDHLIRNAVRDHFSEEITVEFWIRRSGMGYQRIFSYLPEQAGNGFSISVDENRFQVQLGEASVTGGSLERDNWHHIAVTWQGADGRTKIFKDGNTLLSGTLAQGERLAERGSLLLGAGLDRIGDATRVVNDEAFAGRLDDVRIWHDSRAQEDIQREMNKHLTGDEAGLVAYWRFDEGSGQIAFDYSENGNHGQLGSTDGSDTHDPRFVSPTPLTPRTIHVDSMSVSADTETGEQSTPYRTISKALRVAPPNSAIRVAKGGYNEALSIANTEGLKVEGGWDHVGGRWTREDLIDPNLTVIMAPEAPVAVWVKHAAGTLFEGFAVFGAGIGVNVEHSVNVVIRSTIIHIPDKDPDSIGIRCVNMSGRLSRNRVHLNSLNDPAYGILLELLAGDLHIENNVISILGSRPLGILEVGEEATPATLLNNEFYGDHRLILYQDGNRLGKVTGCHGLNDETLNDISGRGGNFCNLLPRHTPCPPPCAEVVALPEPEDADGDEIPDNWEFFHFGDLSPDGTGDADDDGRTDLAEYTGKTTPVAWNLKVTLRPGGAAEAGARWSEDGGETWRDSGEGVSGIGEHAVSFKAIPGWDAPATQTVTPKDDRPISLVANYTMRRCDLELSKEGCDGKTKVNGELHELPWKGEFIWGETATLEAVPGTDCHFAYWFGDRIDTANPIELTMDDDISLHPTFSETGSHFPKPKTTSTHMDIKGTVHDASLQGISGGDELAAFVETSDGLLVIAGYSMYGKDGYFIRVYGDDPATPEKEGAAKGEAIILKTYNQSEEMEHTLRLMAGSSEWEGGRQITCEWRYRTVQRIPLHLGWNLFSFSVNKCFHVREKPACDMIEGIEYEEVGGIDEILGSIAGQYAYVRGFDCTGAKSHNLTPWSDMTYMAAGYGYEIKIREDADTDAEGLIWLEIEGSRVSGKKTLHLHPGWNLVGYLGNKVLYTGAQPDVHFPEDTRFCELVSGRVRDALCSLRGQYIYVKGFDKNGAKSYNLTPWSNLSYMGPGYGYWIKILEDEYPNLMWDSPCIACKGE